MKCGLLGRRLDHSYSPLIHSLLGDYTYALFEKEPQELENFLKNGDFSGINVTVPYKKTVISYLDGLTECAQRLGSVNTIVRREGKLIGHNTDYFGFETMLRASGLSVRDKKCLILGSGGASNTAKAVLLENGAKVTVISRSGENHYGNLHLHADASLLVNTTPVGMYPDVGSSPVDLQAFPSLEGVLDVIYNPARTKLLLDAENRGIVTMNGLLMLVAQAKEAAQWFLNAPISDCKIGQAYDFLRKKTENTILIGMPGCGKTTVGRLLADQLGKRFVDADAEIVKIAGKSIPEIFAADGEACFRRMESEVLAQLGKQSGLVIATGGGCVTREENYDCLHQNGKILWLQRSLEKLPTEGRPLSQRNGPAELYAQRQPMYQRFADHIVCNNGPLCDTLALIMEAIQ